MADRVPGSSKHSRSSPSLEQRYINCCWKHVALPNKALLSAFFKVEVKKTYRQLCSLVVIFYHCLIFLWKLTLLRLIIDAVDIFHNSSCDLNGEYVLLLLRAINQKLRVVNVQDVTFGKEFLRNLSQRGLTCQVLNLRSSHFRKLNMVGKFSYLWTLNLDFSSSLSNFREDCFTCMPNLKCLSLCETRIANLWITSTSLSKLPSLMELRFQHCLCCDDTGPHPASSSGKSTDSGQLDSGLCVGAPSSFDGDYFWHINKEDADMMKLKAVLRIHQMIVK